jgi:hypothetical protein
MTPKQQELLVIFEFQNPEELELGLEVLSGIEMDPCGSIVSGFARNGTPNTLCVWFRPCCADGISRIQKETGAKRAQTKNQ